MVIFGILTMPRTISSIFVPAGSVALFFVLASWILILNHKDSDRKFGAFLSNNESVVLTQKDKSPELVRKDVISEKTTPSSGKSDGLQHTRLLPFGPGGSLDVASLPNKEKGDEINQVAPLGEHAGGSGGDAGNVDIDSTEKSIPTLSLSNQTCLFESVNTTMRLELSKASSLISSGGEGTLDKTVNNSVIVHPPASDMSNGSGNFGSGSCDLYLGKWFYDELGPLYTNSSCPVLTQMQNCQGNGRPDKEYENWRWNPFQCDLPRFDAQKFLELMRGKTLAFIGDSVARNQMESLLCILWQVETPSNRGNRRWQRWYFRSASVYIVRIWSSWLVHKSPDAFQDAPEGINKIFLDVPDEDFMEFLPNYDVVVLSSGHWFAKQAVYILDNEIVGGQLWWPHKSRKMKFTNIQAFGVAMETCLTAIVSHPNYKGLTIVRSFSPDHYEGGAWNTGGSCLGKVGPLAEGQVIKNEFTEAMHAKQVAAYEVALKKATKESNLKLMDITKPFSLRHDGHPGPFRNTDPNKRTKRGPNGEPPPQDCLHWCMPGPVDTWNEFLLAILRSEFHAV